MEVTIEKKITDMAKYGVTGDSRWCGDVIVKSQNGISVHGKYFDTKEKAKDYTDRIYATIKGINESGKDAE